LYSKKYLINLIAAILLFISGNLFAQTIKWELALESGLGVRSLNIDPSYPSLETTAGLSSFAGVAGQFNFDDVWSLKLGAAYEKKGCDIERTDLNTTGEVTMDYITIPVLLKIKSGKKIKFFVNAGPYLGILLSSKNKLNAYSNVSEIETNTDSTTKSTDIGITGGIGMEIPVGRSGAFTLEARDNFGLTNISQSKEANAPQIKTNTADFIIGYVFKFGQKH